MRPSTAGWRLAPPPALLAVLLVAGCGSTVPITGPSGGSLRPTIEAPPSSVPGATDEGASGSSPPSATPAPTVGPCTASQLVARVVSWTGAAGQRVADVSLTDTGATCHLQRLSQPQLVDGHGIVLVDSPLPAASTLLTVDPGGVLTTEVEVGDYCGRAPVPPVTVAFVLPGQPGRVVAIPLSPTDVSGVPSCLGAPSASGTIAMQPWEAKTPASPQPSR